MNTLEPIKNMETILDIADYLRTRDSMYAERNYMLWLTGIYLGLRVSDILTLQVRDVRNKDNVYKREAKTGKENFVEIPKEFKAEIRKYVQGKEDYEYLFTSRKKMRMMKESGEVVLIEKPIGRQQVYELLKDAAGKFCNSRVGTHTMRKTFGYFLYQSTKDIVLVKEVLNHSDINITRRYIGLTQEMKARAVREISYKRERS